MNERITEDLVRSHFKKDPFWGTIKWEEQRSINKNIVALLKGTAKSKNVEGEGEGRPEFIISFPVNYDYIIIFECKADIKNHRSKTGNQPKNFAVDGVLHYAQALSTNYDVIAVAVSGQTPEELLVSHFVWRKNKSKPQELKDKKLLSIHDYLKLFKNEQFADNLHNIDIVQKAVELNEEYHAYSVSEATRCTMVSAILLSLLHDPFRNSYKQEPDTSSLGRSLSNAIETVLKREDVKGRAEMLGEYSKILNEPLFKQTDIKHKNRKEHESTIAVVKRMIDFLRLNVYPLTQMEQSGFDVMGRFYREFIRYAASEQSQGLVLTPPHITNLFSRLANITTESVIYDPCCGTGGFLIAAMKNMLQNAGNNTNKQKQIKNQQLIGVELRPSMYTYACSNMMMQGDGKSNIYCGDCFKLVAEIKKHKPTVAFLNPPYDVGTARQMEFIRHALDVVADQNGMVAAIVQMSCGIKNENDLIAVKKSLLDSHRLHAVLSMPDDLFYPVGVVTAVMIFQANEKHKGRKTWFGYFKDDGFEKRKHRGRVDIRNQWQTIQERWLSAYRNLEEIPGLSVMQEVTAEDEWCAEAYLETDYSTIRENEFEQKVRDFVAFRVRALLTNKKEAVLGNCILKKHYSLDTSHWRWFRYDELFKIIKGKRLTKENMLTGTVPFIGATEFNNGVTAYIDKDQIEDQFIHSGNKITVSYNGSVGRAFYQPTDFFACDDVNVLYPKFKLNRYSAVFITTLIEQEQYRFNYGRKWTKEKMELSKIKLPATINGTPDWDFIENYVKSLPYSENL
ncbi:MAG: N-6 DNA methylase [Planctomycetaceae bacterium]|jgi:type I restriction-modification system DNA methylase subunit|nr:N-6 DNA methylase [Planctomycetaceae bacterium]